MNSYGLEEKLLNIICSVFEAYSAVLFLPNGEGGGYRLAVHHSLGNQINDDVVIQPGNGIVGWIIENQRELVIPNFNQHKNTLGYYRNAEEGDIKAFMGCPIPTGGAICVDSKRQYQFTETDRKILGMFAEAIAQQTGKVGNQDKFIEIPRFFAYLGVIQDLRSRCHNWSEFIQAYLKTIRDATDFSYVAFASLFTPGETYLVESETGYSFFHESVQPQTIPISNGIAGWVFRNEQPFISEGTESASVPPLFGKNSAILDFSTVMCHPIVINKNTQAILCLAHLEPIKLGESIRSFVIQAVDYLSLYLENMYFKTRLRNSLPKITEVHGEDCDMPLNTHAVAHNKH